MVSNRLATAVLYAAAVGTPVEVYGPYFEVVGAAATSTEEHLREGWPEFFDPAAGDAARTALADEELGRPWLRDPVELRQMLGWQTPSPKPGFDYWAGAPLEKALGVLGLRSGGISQEDRVEAAAASPLAFLRHPLQHLPGRLPRRVFREAVEPRIHGPEEADALLADLAR